LLCEETTDLLQKLSLDSQPKAADATEPARTKKVEMKQNIVDFHLVDFHLNLVDETEPRGMSDSDPPICLRCSIQQGAAASQPLSVSIPPERSITPVLQDFMDPNLFYLPAYYYGGD